MLLLLGGVACTQGDPTPARPPVAAPELMRVWPAKGFAGTEVFLEGRNLDPLDAVCLDTKPLGADRFEVVSATRVIVRLPDNVQNHAFLSVTNSAGTAGRFRHPALIYY